MKKFELPISLLSCQNRDVWAEDHRYLLNLSTKNADSFSWIESAIFAMTLDHRIITKDLVNSYRTF
jgi:hypothetical protein